jgi:hypothetical protein
MRDGREQSLTIRVERQPDDTNEYLANARPIMARSVKPLALDVRSLTPTRPGADGPLVR